MEFITNDSNLSALSLFESLSGFPMSPLLEIDCKEDSRGRAIYHPQLPTVIYNATKKWNFHPTKLPFTHLNRAELKLWYILREEKWGRKPPHFIFYIRSWIWTADKRFNLKEDENPNFQRTQHPTQAPAAVTSWTPNLSLKVIMNLNITLWKYCSPSV